MLDYHHLPLQVVAQEEVVGFYRDTENGQMESSSEEEFFQSLDEIEHLLCYSEKIDQNIRMLDYAEKIESPGLSAAQCFTPWLSYSKDY